MQTGLQWKKADGGFLSNGSEGNDRLPRTWEALTGHGKVCYLDYGDGFPNRHISSLIKLYALSMCIVFVYQVDLYQGVKIK